MVYLCYAFLDAFFQLVNTECIFFSWLLHANFDMGRDGSSNSGTVFISSEKPVV